MGVFDARREQLGIGGGGNQSTSDTGTVSVFDKRRAQIAQNDQALQTAQDEQTQMDTASKVAHERTVADQMNLLKSGANLDVSKSPKMQEIHQYNADNPVEQKPNDQQIDQSRELPIIGPVFRFLDKVGTNPITETIADIGRSLYTPGASLENVAGLAGAAENAVSRLAPGLGKSLAGRVAQKAATEAIVGAPLTAGQSLTQTGDLQEAAKQGLIGAGIGGGIGALGPLAKAGIGKFAERRQTLGISGAPEQTVVEHPNTTAPESVTNPTAETKPPAEVPTTQIAPNSVPSQELVDRYNNTKKQYDEVNKEISSYSESLSAKDKASWTPEEQNKLDELYTNSAGAFREMNKAHDAMPEHLLSDVTSTEPIKQSWFSSLFGHDQNVGITPFSSSKSGRIVTTEQQIVNNPLKSTVSGLWQGTKQASRATYHNTVDYLSPLKNINRETYNTAMDASRANNLANTIVRDKFVDNEGNVIGSSLDDIMKQGRGLGKKLDDYLVLRHAETRMSRGEAVYDNALNMTSEKAKEAYTRLEARYPQLKQIGAEWDKFNTNMLDSGVREGLISQEARDAMREQNPNYASMRRQFTIGEKLAQPRWGSGGSSFSGQKAPIKEVSPTGSTRKIVSPIRSAIEQTYAWKNAELRNRTMQEIVKSIQMDPEGMSGIVELVKKPSTSYKSLDDALREGGSEEFLQQLDNDFKSLFQQHKTGDENVVRAMVKGNPVFIKVHDPEAVKALLGMGAEQSGIVLGALKKLSNATKRGATGVLAPMFAVKNLTADTVQGAIQSPNAFKHVAVDVPVAFFSSIGEALHIPGLRNLAEDFRRSGGEYSALLRGDRGVNNAVYNLRREAPLSAKGIVKGAVAAVKAPFKALEKVSDITENVNRMAAFRRAMAGKERTPENVRNAINAARESTTNFSRRGAFARETEAFIPYSNAAVQGMYRMSKAIIKNPVKTLAGVGTLVIAPKLYEYAKFNDDPDYQKLPARERYRNIITSKNADGTFNKIPMPPEYEALGGFMTDVLNHVLKNDPNAYKGTLDALANAWTPPMVSGGLQGLTQGGGMEQSLAGAANATTLAPAAALLANKSFTGAPIVPQRLAGNSPGQQYDERTSNPAKFVGQKIGMSPMKVDYLLRAYGGDPSRLLLPLMSDVGAGTPRNTLLKNFIVDPQVTNTLSNDFYNMKQRITEAESDNKSKGVLMPKWYDKKLADDMTTQSKAGIAKQLSNLNDEKRKVQADKSLSAQVKANQLRDLQARMNNIYLDANTRMQQGGVPKR